MGWYVLNSAGAKKSAVAESNDFGTIAVSGQSNVVSDSQGDTLTLAAGSNITITTDAGTDTVTIAATGIGLTLSTEQSLSGTAIDFTSIPAGTKQITVMLEGISSNGTGVWCLMIGDAGGIENTGYTGAHGLTFDGGASDTAEASATSVFQLTHATAAAGTYGGVVVLTLKDAANFTWMAHWVMWRQDVSVTWQGAGVKSLSAELDRLRLLTGVSDTLDAGSINIAYM